MTSYNLWYVVQSAEVARLDQKENLLSNNHLSGEWVPARRGCLFPLQLMLIFYFHFFREEGETYRRWTKSGDHQLRSVVFSHYLQGFIHPRWLALGFLNHQRYDRFCAVYEVMAPPVSPLFFGSLNSDQPFTKDMSEQRIFS